MHSPGDVIKDSRKKAGLTQEELAAKIGVKGPSVVYWESDKNQPRGKNLIKLCKILNLTPEKIYGPDFRSEAENQAFLVSEAFLRSSPEVQEAVKRVLQIAHDHENDPRDK